MDASRTECHVCGQIDGDPARDLIARLLSEGPYVRRVILESAAFAAIPSLGPLADGHTLLCPKDHVRSFAALPGALDAEFQTVKRTLRTTLQQLFGGTVLQFEHGMAADGHRVLCTVDHAHLHFVPLHRTSSEVVRPDLPWRAFDGSLGDLGRIAGRDEYVSLQFGEEVGLVASGGEAPFESQLMRKAVAAGGDWDWREHPRPAAAHATWQRVFSHGVGQ